MPRRKLKHDLIGKLILVTSVSVLLPGCIWMFDRYDEYRTEQAQVRERLLEAHKSRLVTHVDLALDYIAFKRREVEQRHRDRLARNVHDTHNTLLSLHQRSHPHDGEDLHIELLRSVVLDRFEADPEAHCFIIDESDRILLHTLRPDLVGKHISEWLEASHPGVLEAAEAVMKAAGEGHLQYPLPGEPLPEGMKAYIGFITWFEPHGWTIGSMQEMDEIREAAQTEALDWLEQIHFEHDGYIFAGTMKGLSLLGPARGQNMLGVMDRNGRPVVKDLIVAASAGGGFVEYVMPPIKDQLPVEKLSYARADTEWGWYVGAGVLLEDVRQATAAAYAEGHDRMIADSVKILMVLLVCLFAAWLIALNLARRMSGGFRQFVGFFDRAAFQREGIDPQSFHYDEFAHLADATNHMLCQRDEAEAAVEREKQRLGVILSALRIGLVVVTREKRVDWVNEHFRAMFPGNQYEGEACTEVLGGAIACCADPVFNTVFVEGASLTRETRDPSGEHYYQVLLHPIKNEQGEVDKALISVLDMTEQREAEEERIQLEGRLRQSQKMEALGTLAGGVAHDFNNLLAAMQGYCELASGRLPEDHPSRADLNEVATAVERATELVRQILTFSRRRSSMQTSLRLQEIMREVRILLRHSVPDCVDLKYKVIESCAPILGDAGQMHQLLVNLINNAIQAIEDRVKGEPDGATHEVRVELEPSHVRSPIPIGDLRVPEGQYALLRVRDEGIGMDPATRQRIFEPYFTTKILGRGTGLGMAMVHGIVKSHAGYIHCTSELGRYTEFSIWLPISTQPPSDLKPADPLPGASILEPQAMGRALICDDEPTILHIGGRMLKSLGFEVEAFDSPTEALEAFRARPEAFRIVVSDLVMPELSGIDLIKQIKSIQPSMPCIIWSGLSESNEIDFPDGLIHARIAKPFRIHHLAMAMRQALDPASSGEVQTER